MKIYGCHAVQAGLAGGTVTQIYYLKSHQNKRVQTILAEANALNIAVSGVTKNELDAMLPGAVHQGIIAQCVSKAAPLDIFDLLETIEGDSTLLLLDQIQDPHNLGACLRTANGAGVDAVVAPKSGSASVTPTVSKVACGALETLPFYQVPNLVQLMRELKDMGYWLYGLCGEAQQSIYQTEFSGKVALVMGGEGKGLRQLTRQHCDVLLSIPMYGSVSSLNVSVAAGVSLFEVCRNRQKLAEKSE